MTWRVIATCVGWSIISGMAYYGGAWTWPAVLIGGFAVGYCAATRWGRA